MKAALVQSFDAPPVYTDFPAPTAAEGEQLVTVKAAALHQIVKSLANGSHYGSTGELPFIPGVDGAGTLADGTRVYFGGARFPYGTMCEQTVISGPMFIPLPDGISDAVAAGIANPAMSSWVALTSRAKFVPGESVLILGATGVSGQLAVQIAKYRGARHIVAAGRNPEALIAAIAQRGGLSHSSSRIRYIDIGSTAGPNISLPAAALRSSGLELLGSGFGSASMTQIRQAITEFFALAATQPFEFSLKTAPLSEVATLWNEKDQATRIVFLP